MTVTPRILALAVAASATLGGGVGALATAATTSQANPQAIAAAIQRVRDTAAEERLSVIENTLHTIHLDLNASPTLGSPGFPKSAIEVLKKICSNTNHPSPVPQFC